jgi:hypothetical protein
VSSYQAAQYINYRLCGLQQDQMNYSFIINFNGRTFIGRLVAGGPS